MKATSKRIWLVMAALAVSLISAQMYGGGISLNSATPAFAEEDETYDYRLLLRAIKPRTNYIPKRGMLIAWFPMTSARHEGIAPPGAEGQLPESFSIVRRAGGSTTSVIATVANDTSVKRLKYVDSTVLPRSFYKYKLIVNYPNDYSVELRHGKTKIMDSLMLGANVQVSQVDEGVKVRWRQAHWAPEQYAVFRINERGINEIIGTVPHEPGVKHLEFIDTEAEAGATYKYGLRAPHGDYGNHAYVPEPYPSITVE